VELLEQFLLAFFIATHDPSTRDLLSPSQSAVIAALFGLVHLPTRLESVLVGIVADLATKILDATGERFKLNPRATSSILAGMGFSNRSRSSQGSLVSFDKETVAKIHRLMRIHDVQWPESVFLITQKDTCSFCTNSPSRISTGSDE
jgi:hypothetical protein